MWEESLTFFSTTNSFSAVALRATSSSYLRREGTGEALGMRALDSTLCAPWEETLGPSGLLFLRHKELIKRALDMESKPLVAGPSLD